MFLNSNDVLECWEITNKGEGVMNKRHMFYVGMMVLAALALLGVPMSAMAVHPDVPLLQANGSAVATNTPYSPKLTCSANACHAAGMTHEGVTYTAAELTAIHNYGSGTKNSIHVQGVLGGDNKVYWQADQNVSFEHGASVGRHMNQGRNEDYLNKDRAAVGDPWFTSSFGMFGKY
jgi:hypothetical protein